MATIDADSILKWEAKRLPSTRKSRLDSSGSIPATSITVPDDACLWRRRRGRWSCNHASSDSYGHGHPEQALFTVTQPSISLEPATVAMGNDVTVTGEGWVTNSIVTIEMKRTRGQQACVDDGRGYGLTVLSGFSTSMTVPNNVGVGPQDGVPRRP